MVSSCGYDFEFNCKTCFLSIAIGLNLPLSKCSFWVVIDLDLPVAQVDPEYPVKQVQVKEG